jgi:hypothetical protein
MINSNKLHCALGDFPGADHRSTPCREAMEGEMTIGEILVAKKI